MSRERILGAIEALEEVRRALPVGWGSRADAIRDKYRRQLAALGPEPEAETGAYKLFVWTDHCTFAAVAHAKNVAQARELIEGEDLGGHDGSCPERVAARKMIYGETPGIYRGGQAVLMFDTGKPDPEQPWTPRERRLREALERLTVKLDEVHKSREYAAVWYLAHLHDGAYCGPTYTKELEEAVAAIADTPPPDPRDEALETLYELAKVDYSGDAVIRLHLPPEADWDNVAGYWTMGVFLAAIRAARGSR